MSLYLGMPVSPHGCEFCGEDIIRCMVEYFAMLE
jgi:hypothetical protein